MRFAIWSLAAAAFARITTEFNIVGVLPLIARDLSVPIPQVGLLVTAFAFTVAVAGPFLTIAFARANRRMLFTGILVVSGVGNAIAALAPNYPLLAVGRIVSALALPVFWSMASSTAAGIAGPERAGRAIATVFAGISIASVCGVPVTTLIASAWGWRAAFAAAGAVCLAMALTIWLVFPRSGLEVPPVARSPMMLLRQRTFLAHLLLSFLVLTAMFTAYTYLADSRERIGKYDPSTVGWALIGFGAAGIIGNSFAGRSLDESPMRASLAAAAVVGGAMAASASAIASPFSGGIVLVLWGAAHAASFVANHVRVIKAAPVGYEDIAASMNVSVFNTGIGMGAIVGGRLIDAVGLSYIGWGAGAIIAIALILGTVLQRAGRSTVDAGIARTS